MRKYLAIVILGFLLWGCATGYNSKSLMGGFSEKKLENGNYEVMFKGNSHTSVKKVKKYLLRRCAELTIENNFEYFEIIEDKSKSDISQQYSVSSGFYATSSHSGYCIIKMLEKKPDKISENVYNATKYLERNNY